MRSLYYQVVKARSKPKQGADIRNHYAMLRVLEMNERHQKNSTIFYILGIKYETQHKEKEFMALVIYFNVVYNLPQAWKAEL